jgi:hypothetical protein
MDDMLKDSQKNRTNYVKLSSLPAEEAAEVHETIAQVHSNILF